MSRESYYRNINQMARCQAAWDNMSDPAYEDQCGYCDEEDEDESI